MRVNKKGIELIKKYEGCRLTAYKDSVGVLTIGYGHTGKDVKSKMTITEEDAEELLKKDLARFEEHVNSYRKYYKWTQNEFNALVSFAYNIGNINQLTKNGKRNKGQIADAMLMYVKAGGKTLSGLVKRRRAERELFCTPSK